MHALSQELSSTASAMKEFKGVQQCCWFKQNVPVQAQVQAASCHLCISACSSVLHPEQGIASKTKNCCRDSTP